MQPTEILNQYKTFLTTYEPIVMDALWREKSNEFKHFWQEKILNKAVEEIADSEIDEIVRILDRNARGNTASDEAVAKAMVTMGTWRRMFKDIKEQKSLQEILTTIFEAKVPQEQIKAIDELYKVNEKNKNGLTGRSANSLNAMIFTYDPGKNVSIVSLNHRQKVIMSFGFSDSPDFEIDTQGVKIVQSNQCIINGFRSLGITDSPRSISTFLYKSAIADQWNTKSEEDIPWGGYLDRGDVQQEGIPAILTPAMSTDPALFYMESQLEDFLIQNWEHTELGKKYDLIEEDGNLVSQQYKIDIGRIDILAQDKVTQQLVVIELKKNQTSDDTVGQITRYMGWLDEHKPTRMPSKGIIISAQYDDRLYYALRRVQDVEVFLYKVDFKLQEFRK